MLPQSSTQSQRNKGFNINSTLRVAFLLAVVVWLLYRVNPSHERKADNAETDQNKLAKRDRIISLGRKGQAGFESGISIVADRVNFDEQAETNETGGDRADVIDLQTDEKEEEVALSKEDEEFQGGILNTRNQGTQPVQHGSGDDNGDSQMYGDGASDKGTGEENGLHNDGDNIQNFRLDVKSEIGETTGSNEETNLSSTYPTKIYESTTQANEVSDINSELNDDATPEAEGFSNSIVSDNHNNSMTLKEDEVDESEKTESQGDSTSGIDIGDSNALQGETTDLRTDSKQQNNVAFTDSGDVEREEAEPTSQAGVTDDHTVEAANYEMRSNDELVTLLTSEGESNDASEVSSAEPQLTSPSESKFANNNYSEETETKATNDELAKSTSDDVQSSTEVLKNDDSLNGEAVESQESDISDANFKSNNALEEGKTNPQSTAEFENSLLTNEDENANLLASSGAAQAEQLESQGGGVSEAMNADNRSIEETNSKTNSNDEVTDSFGGKKEKDAELPNYGTSNREMAESQGDIAPGPKSIASDALGDAKLEPMSNNETSSRLADNINFSGGNGNADVGQKGGVPLETFSSVEAPQQDELIDQDTSQNNSSGQ